MKSGFVSIIGMPNVGKSSLLNTLLGQKVSIVSKKPQTTRHKILGIFDDDNHQIVFLDTPGVLINSTTKLDAQMTKQIKEAQEGVDIILFVIDAQKGIDATQKDLINKASTNGTVIVVVNKIDLINYDKLMPLLLEISQTEGVKEVVPVAAKKGKNIDKLLEVLIGELPDTVRYFDKNQITDKSTGFLVAELIREKTLRLLNQEVPHGIFVEIEKFENKKTIINIEAAIVVEKESHKKIVIGAGGAKIKDIGTRARQSIESLVGKKVFLKLFVKVRANWRENPIKVDELFKQ